MWINTNWSLIDRFCFFLPNMGRVMFNISIWSNICSHGTSFSDSRRISDRPRCDFAVCRSGSSPSLRYSDRFALCGIFCATPWGFNFAYSPPFDIANPDPYVATGRPPGRALTMHRAPSVLTISITGLYDRRRRKFPVKLNGEPEDRYLAPCKVLYNILPIFVGLHCSKVPAQDIGRRSSSQEFFFRICQTVLETTHL